MRIGKLSSLTCASTLALSLLWASGQPATAQDAKKPEQPASAAAESNEVEDISGEWVSKEKETELQITIVAKDGLFHIKGNDKASDFQSTCLSYGEFARCVGHGTTRGSKDAGFLTESFLRVTTDGEMVETWIVKGADQEIAGQTLLTRKK